MVASTLPGSETSVNWLMLLPLVRDIPLQQAESFHAPRLLRHFLMIKPQRHLNHVLLDSFTVLR